MGNRPSSPPTFGWFRHKKPEPVTEQKTELEDPSLVDPSNPMAFINGAFNETPAGQSNELTKAVEEYKQGNTLGALATLVANSKKITKAIMDTGDSAKQLVNWGIRSLSGRSFGSRRSRRSRRRTARRAAGASMAVSRRRPSGRRSVVRRPGTRTGSKAHRRR